MLIIFSPLSQSAFITKKGYGKVKSEASSFLYPSKLQAQEREENEQNCEISGEAEYEESDIDFEEAQMERKTVEMFIEDIQKEKPVRFSSQDIECFTWNYSMKIGSGGFGEVYKGEFPNGMPVAIKLLYNNGIDKRVEEQFMAELSTIWRTNHRNLVRLYGFCFDAKTKALVYEYMENGSLDKLLFGKQNIEWGKLFEIAVGSAKGLEYMHHHSHKRIIHYDIKPGNVLLDSSYSPKIADFGLAKLCNKDSTLITFSGARGTPGYAAPELWLPFPVTCKCDVYSFGMMLFEIIGRRRNLDINVSESQEWFPKRVWDKLENGELEEILIDCGIGERDLKKAKSMCLLALWCVQYLPDARPFMSDVVRYLEGVMEIQTPPNPFKHLVSSDARLPSCSDNSLASTVDTEISEDNREDSIPIMRKYEIEGGSSNW